MYLRKIINKLRRLASNKNKIEEISKKWQEKIEQGNLIRKPLDLFILQNFLFNNEQLYDDCRLGIYPVFHKRSQHSCTSL